MMLLERKLDGPISKRDRVTATEIIDGVRHVVVLEQNMFGRYCETLVLPVAPQPGIGSPAHRQAANGEPAPFRCCEPGAYPDEVGQ